MNMNSIISLLGGLGTFLFGMHYMGEGLELAAGRFRTSGQGVQISVRGKEMQIC